MNFLFILTVKSIFSSVVGSQFYKWYQTTTLGIYFQNRIDQFMEYLSAKYDLELIKKQSKFEADYPLMKKRIEYLESIAHAKCGIEEFDGYKSIDERISQLEKRKKVKKK